MSKAKHISLDIVGYRIGQALRRMNIPTLYISKLFYLWFRLTRSVTLSVRIAAFNENGKIFLIRHTYVGGWHMPGGGVERNETAIEAMHKELMEEGNLVCQGEPELFSVYVNKNVSRLDHVLLYKCIVMQSAPRVADAEIADSGFFPIDQLPDNTHASVLARLSELGQGSDKSPYWV